MGELMGFIAAAVIVEGIISYANEIVKNKKIHWEIIGAILIGCIVSYNLNLDFFKMLGLKETYGIIGIILTGVLISRGSNYVFELYDRLTKWKNEDK